jgi:hypothetical protein
MSCRRPDAPSDFAQGAFALTFLLRPPSHRVLAPPFRPVAATPRIVATRPPVVATATTLQIRAARPGRTVAATTVLGHPAAGPTPVVGSQALSPKRLETFAQALEQLAALCTLRCCAPTHTPRAWPSPTTARSIVAHPPRLGPPLLQPIELRAQPLETVAQTLQLRAGVAVPARVLAGVRGNFPLGPRRRILAIGPPTLGPLLGRQESRKGESESSDCDPDHVISPSLEVACTPRG